MIQAGQLRHLIKIQKPVDAQDESGQMTTAFQDLYSFEDEIRADVYPLSGNEYIAARQVIADVTTRITIRRYPGIDATCRVVELVEDDSPPTEEVYDILAVLPDSVSGMRYLTLMCKQSTVEGFRRGE